MANFFSSRHGRPGTRLQTITVKLASGKLAHVTVHEMAAPHIKGFLEDLIKAGCPIKSIGGFNIRRIAGSRRLSQHSWGGAIDLNQVGRDKVVHGLKEWATTNRDLLNSLEKKWRMEGGHHWRNPDLGHWEFKGPK